MDDGATLNKAVSRRGATRLGAAVALIAAGVAGTRLLWRDTTSQVGAGGLVQLDLDVGGIEDREAATGEALARGEVQQVKSVLARGLIVLIVADHGAEEVGRQNFR